MPVEQVGRQGSQQPVAMPHISLAGRRHLQSDLERATWQKLLVAKLQSIPGQREIDAIDSPLVLAVSRYRTTASETLSQ